MNDQVAEILQGSFDLHVHAGPDPGEERRVDALDAARYAHEAEMRGFVLKSNHYPTAPLAYTLNRVYPGMDVVGAVALNLEVGGLNPYAVEASAAMGAKVVWMPTYNADVFVKGDCHCAGIRILNEAGRLKPEVYEIIEIVKHRDMVLASGHLAPDDTIALFTAASDAGVKRMLATCAIGIASNERLARMASLKALVELTMLACMPASRLMTLERTVEVVKDIGEQYCVVTTDFGQMVNPPPAEGMRMAIAGLLEAGLESEEVATLVKTNPIGLVGLNS